MNTSSYTSRVIVALDFADPAHAWSLVDHIEPNLCRLKVGKELFVRGGPDFVRQLVQRGYDVFLDLKFHDIPHTVAQACRAAADLGVWMINVHASGGARMLQAAKEALVGIHKPPHLIAVTVLTSMDETDLRQIGVMCSPLQQVLQLSALAEQAGLDGVVCAATEASALRRQCRPGFLLVTPGIRLAGDTNDDQKRVMTPESAWTAGVDYVVMGRSITKAADPRAVLQGLMEIK